VEKFEGEVKTLEGQYRIVSRAFVADESVGRVNFVPRVVEVDFLEAGADLVAAFEGDVRILTSKNHEEVAFDFCCASEGVVVAALAEGA